MKWKKRIIWKSIFYVIPLFIFFTEIIFAFPIDFVSQTLNNATYIDSAYYDINSSVTTSNLSELIYNWNGTNYTIYNSSLRLMMSFENNSAIGDNGTNSADISPKKNDGKITGAVLVNNGRYGKGYHIETSKFINLGVLWGFETHGGFTNTGLDYDNSSNTLWMGDFDNDRIVNVYRNGTFISNCSVTSGAQIQEVAYDSSDNTIWYADSINKIIMHINQTSCEEINDNFSLSFNPSGVAYDSSDDTLWVPRASNTLIYHYNASNGINFENATINGTGFTTFDGIDYDSSDDTLWLTSDPNYVLQINATLSSGNASHIKNFTVKNSVEGIAVDPTDNTLWVNVDDEYHNGNPNGNRVFHLNKSGTLLDTPNTFTFMFWINPNTTADQFIFNQWTSALGFRILVRESSNNLQTFIRQSNGVQKGGNFGYNLPINTFTHITIVANSSDLIVYINGTELSTRYSYDGTLLPSYADTELGRSGTSYANATFDEIMLFDGALSTVEIVQHYMSNLRKYDSDKWSLTINQSKNSTAGLDDGTYTYYIFAQNSSGATNITDIRTIGIDTINPLLSYGVGTENTYTNFSRSNIYVNLSLTELNVQNITFNLYNDTELVNSTIYTNGTSTHNWTNIIDNNYSYEVNITDKANHKNSTGIRYLTLDTTAPVITFSCTPSSVEVGKTVTCACSGIDARFNINTTTYTANPSTSSTGTFTETCSINDILGNLGSTTFSYLVEASFVSGSGRNGNSGTNWINTYIYDDKDLSEKDPFNKIFGKSNKVRIKINKEEHYIGIKKILSNSSIIIEVASRNPQEATLTVGDTKKFEVNDDNFYDIGVTLKSITNGNANLSVFYIHEEIPAEIIQEEKDNGEATTGEEYPRKTNAQEKENMVFIEIIMVILIVFLLAIITATIRKKKN